MTARIASAAVLLAVASLALPACRGGGAFNDDPYRQNAIEAALDTGPKVDRLVEIDYPSFTKVAIVTPTIAPNATQGDEVSDEQLANLQADFERQLREAFEEDGRRIVPVAEADAQTFVVRAEIVRAVPNKPLRNIAPQTQMTRTGYGYASGRIVLERGGTGELLVVATETQSTKRFGTEKLSEWGTVEKAFESWAAEAVKLSHPKK